MEDETTEEEKLEEERRKYAFNFPERQKAKESEKKQEITKKAVEKQQYTVVVEAWAKTTFKYKVLAESPEQAVQLIDDAPLLEPPKPKPFGIKKVSAKVYLFGSNMLKYMRNF